MQEDYSRESRNIPRLVSNYENLLGKGRETSFSAEDYIDIAEFYMKDSRFTEAAEALRIAERLYPENIDVKVMQAYLLKDEGQWQRALEIINSLSNIDNRDVTMFKIEHQLSAYHPEEAEAMFSNMIKYVSIPDLAEMHLAFAELLFNYGFSSRAEEWLTSRMPHKMEALMDSDAQRKQYFELRADICYQLHRFDEAVVFANKLIDVDPYDEISWIQLAEIYTTKGDFTNAIDSIEYAISISPESVKAMRQKLLILTAQGLGENYNDVRNTYNEYLRFVEDDYPLHIAVGSYFAYFAHNDDSLRSYSLALRYCPVGSSERVGILRGIASAYVNLGNYKGALEALLSSMGPQDNVLKIYFEVAEACRVLGNKQACSEILMEYIKAYSPSQEEVQVIKEYFQKFGIESSL